MKTIFKMTAAKYRRLEAAGKRHDEFVNTLKALCMQAPDRTLRVSPATQRAVDPNELLFVEVDKETLDIVIKLVPGNQGGDAPEKTEKTT